MKKIIYILLINIALTNLVYGQRQSSEITVELGGGLSSLKYNVEQGKSKLGFGGQTGIGYTLFLSDFLGIGTAVNFSLYNSSIDLSGISTHLYNLKDGYQDVFNFTTNLTHYIEKQRLITTEIPFNIKFTAGKKTIFYAQAGVIVAIPFKLNYSVKNAEVYNTAYYPIYENTIDAPNFQGLGTFTKLQFNGQTKLNVAFAASVDLGFKWLINRNVVLYTGIYGKLGFNDMLPDFRSDLVKYNVSKPDEFTMNCVTTSRAEDGKQFINKASLFSAGITLKIGYKFYKVNKEELAQKSDIIPKEKEKEKEVQKTDEPTENQKILKEIENYEKEIVNLKRQKYQLSNEEYQRQYDILKQKIENAVARLKGSDPKAEQERIAKENVEKERTTKQKAEQERIAQQNAEKERIAQQKAEQERIAQQNAEKERIAQQKAEQERIAQQKAEQERIAQQKAEQERIAQQNAEKERIAQQKAEQEQLAQEKAEQERIAQQKAEKERLAQQKAEQERIAQQKAERERIAQQKAEQERIAKEKAEKERLAQQKTEQDRFAQEKARQQHLTDSLAKVEKARLQTEQDEKERIEKLKIEASRLEAEKQAKEKEIARLLAEQKIREEEVAKQKAKEEKIIAEQQARLEKMEQENSPQRRLEDINYINGYILRGFEFKESSLTPLQASELAIILKTMQKYPDIKIICEGHTDERGSDGKNNEVGFNRAMFVKNYLVTRGISASRITAISKAHTEPLVPNINDENRAINRRVVIKVVE